MKNEVILWPLTSSKIIVLVAQPILTDGGPPAWAVDKRAELGWPSSRGKGQVFIKRVISTGHSSILFVTPPQPVIS